jgi:type II secretory pathway component PulF
MPPTSREVGCHESVNDQTTRHIQKDDMTYEMGWGIVIGLALIFGAWLRWYRHRLLRKQEIRWLDKHHVLDKLRKRFGR